MTIFFDDNALAQGTKEAEAATRICKENQGWGHRMIMLQDRRWLSLADQITLAKASGSLQGRREPGRGPEADQSFFIEVDRRRRRQERVHGA